MDDRITIVRGHAPVRGGASFVTSFLQEMVARVRTWAMMLLFAVGVVGVAPLLLLLFLFIRRKVIIFGPVRLFFRVGLWMVGVRVEVEGLDHLDPRQSYLFLSNHQSMLDILALLVHLPRTPAFLIKKELFRLPIFNPGLYWIDCVPVDRSHRERAIESVQRAAAALRQGIDFVAYPEGTRTRTGQLQPFKKGAFYMALEAGVPIVPITVAGAFELMPKGKIRCRPGTIRLVFHPPVSVEGYTTETIGDLIARVRQAIASVLVGGHASPGAEGIKADRGEITQRGEECITAGHRDSHRGDAKPHRR